MSELDFYDEMRQVSRQHYADIWQTANLGDHLEDEDARLAQAMRDCW
jgi:hypothetical protein